MTHYELRTPSGRPFCTFDQPDRARAFRAERATLNISRCRFCHGWHIGRGK